MPDRSDRIHRTRGISRFLAHHRFAAASVAVALLAVPAVAGPAWATIATIKIT